MKTLWNIASQPRCVATVAFTICTAGALCGCATAPREQSLTEQQRNLNVESFEYVWTTVRDTHFDPELGGLDWDAIHQELLPQISQAETMNKARSVINGMLARLEQTHFGIIPASAYESMAGPEEAATDNDQEEDEDEDGMATHGTSGIDVRVIDGVALVTAVDDASAAAELGVKTGWIIEQIEGVEVAEKLEIVSAAYEDKTLKDLVLSRVVTGHLEGDLGEELTVNFLNGDDEPIELALTMRKESGRRTKFGHLPAFYVRTTTRRLDRDLGYFSFNGFFDPAHVMGEFAKAMGSLMDAEGMIIDVRGNGGGIGAMSMGMAGWFVADSNQKLGTTYMRDMQLKFVVNRRAQVYAGPLVILVDGLSASTSEIFAGGLKDLKRACIIGSRTAGAALPSKIEQLPNGDGFQYAFANYVSDGGDELEGIGVAPDVEVNHSREALLAGRDLALEAAIAWIRESE